MGILRTSPCNLCPRACGALRDAGEHGACGADNRILLARAALHFWEEPCLSGTRGSGALFFVNCSLRCVYCQNAEIAAGGAGVEVSVERIAELCLDLQEQGALNINCVTPTHYAPAIIDAIALARSRGLSVPVVWNTSGYETVDAIRALNGTVDVYLTDFKYADASLARRYSHAADYPQVALAALDEMVAQIGAPCFDEVDGQPRLLRGVVMRHLVLPGAVRQSKDVLALLFDRYGDAILYSIMNQYTPVVADRAAAGDGQASAVLEKNPELGKRVTDEEYEDVLDFADDLGISDYYWQDGPAALESFIPAWDGTGL